MKYKVLNETPVYNGYFQLIEADIEHELYNGSSIRVKRLAFERGDSAAILLYETDSQSFLLTGQFRYPTCKHKKGWIREIVAGSIESGEDPEACIIREVREELGYEISEPNHIHTFYTSPGGCTERMFLYYSEVCRKDKKLSGGGAAKENEDIQLIRIPGSRIKEELNSLEDAKTIIALQWFLLNKTG